MLTSRSMHNKCIFEKFGSANFTFLSILCRVLRPRHTANVFVCRVPRDGTRQKFFRYVFQMFAECLNCAVGLIRKHTAKVGQV